MNKMSTRLSSILLAVVMVLTLMPLSGMAAKATVFSDMQTSDYYADAAVALAQLDVLDGYPDGTFGADKNVTRAEMAAIVCRMIEKENDAEDEKGATAFEDVSAYHWASGYINVASADGIINGDGNGKFRPEDSVKYEEAIKMVVCALGYAENIKVDPNDWSKAYLNLAEEKGISDALRGSKGKAASRGDIAVMAYNGLTADLVAPTPSLSAGTYKGTQIVKLNTTTENVDIYYTVDGSTPTINSIKYKNDVTIPQTSVLQAIAVKDGVLVSDVMRTEYNITARRSGSSSRPAASTTYTVSFDLNYEGATGAPEAQTVRKGNTVTEPMAPSRNLFEFAGWFTDKTCKIEYNYETPVSKSMTLYAGWYSTLYGIHDMTIQNDSKVVSTISTDANCKLEIKFLNADTKKVILKQSRTVDASMQNAETSISISSEQLPEYFLLTADLLDSSGKKLCKTYTCIDYTPEYMAFMSKTVNDFPQEDVINFDESTTNNFAVLSEDVEKVDLGDDAVLLNTTEAPNDIKNVLNEEKSDFTNNYFEIENINEDLLDTKVGDILYLEYGDGYIITVERFEITNTQTLKVWGSMSCDLKDYFDYIKVDMELDPASYEEIELPEYREDQVELTAEIVDVDVTLPSLKLAIPVELSCQNQAETRTGKFEASVSVELKPKLVIKWDAHLFSEDYFEFKASLETTTGINASLEYSRTNSAEEEEIEYDEMLKKVADIPLGKVLIPFGVTGLGASVELTVPLSVEFKASANFTATTTTTSFFSYDTINGSNTGKETKNTKSFTVEGEVEVKIGPKLEESIEFLGGVIKASLEQNGGAYIDVKATLNITNSDHLCTFCASGEFGLFLTVSAKLSYKITDNFKGTPINFTFYDAKWKLVDCHFSSISGFGFGECPNVSTNWDGQCTLTGKITIADRDTDNTNNAPLKDALVSIKKKDSNKSASTLTSNTGSYSIENVPAGEYVITISKSNYITVTQSITITDSETNHYNAAIEAVSEEDNGEGKASGKIYDAVTGAGIKGLKLVIRKGLNNIVGNAEQILTSGDNGTYTTKNLSAGNYTVQIVDERSIENEEERYYTSAFSIKILGNCTISNQDGVATNGLTADQLRIVLRWGETPRDLDSHIVGPKSNGGRFHVYYSDKKHSESGQKMVDLDLDDTSSYGPETTTIYTPISGSYTFFVHDYSNKNSSGSTAMSNSGAYVEVYLGTSTNAAMTFYVPQGAGTLWTVFRYDSDTGKIEPINTMSNQSSPGEVGLYGLMPGSPVQNDANIVLESVRNKEK